MVHKNAYFFYMTELLLKDICSTVEFCNEDLYDVYNVKIVNE